MNTDLIFSLTFYGLEFTCCVICLNPSNPSQLQVGFPVNKTISYAHLNHPSQHFRGNGHYNTVFRDKTDSL